MAPSLTTTWGLWATFIGFILLVAGLSTFLTGCDHKIQSECSMYSYEKTQVVGHGVADRECKECIRTHTVCKSRSSNGRRRTSCEKQCAEYRYFDCYQGYSVEEYQVGDQSKQCKLFYGDKPTSNATALWQAVHQWPMNTTYHRYINKNKPTCKEAGRIESLAVTGVSLLSVAGFVFLVACAIFCVSYVYGSDQVLPTTPGGGGIEMGSAHAWKSSPKPSNLETQQCNQDQNHRYVQQPPVQQQYNNGYALQPPSPHQLPLTTGHNHMYTTPYTVVNTQVSTPVVPSATPFPSSYPYGQQPSPTYFTQGGVGGGGMGGGGGGGAWPVYSHPQQQPQQMMWQQSTPSYQSQPAGNQGQPHEAQQWGNNVGGGAPQNTNNPNQYW